MFAGKCSIVDQSVKTGIPLFLQLLIFYSWCARTICVPQDLFNSDSGKGEMALILLQPLVRLLEARRFPVERAVNLIVPFEDAAISLRSWSENPSRFQKILVSLALRGSRGKEIMHSHYSCFLGSFCRLRILLVACALSVAHAQNPAAPTASEDPTTIDQTWQKASSK